MGAITITMMRIEGQRSGSGVTTVTTMAFAQSVPRKNPVRQCYRSMKRNVKQIETLKVGNKYLIFLLKFNTIEFLSPKTRLDLSIKHLERKRDRKRSKYTEKK